MNNKRHKFLLSGFILNVLSVLFFIGPLKSRCDLPTSHTALVGGAIYSLSIVCFSLDVVLDSRKAILWGIVAALVYYVVYAAYELRQTMPC